MEGVKERERERGEEKESDEMEEEEKESEAEEEGGEEEEDEDAEGAALVWQEGSYGEDDLGLPIMHWEALSLRIAELEKQEEEKREKTKVCVCVSEVTVECCLLFMDEVGVFGQGEEMAT